ncbi:hypothetical protein MHBO_002804 [Bonamia ostreae]|uniref:Serine hydroxymethyltransferase-like domain-containing protein n=1 Tax=Bonamia ostreae TaxID=126728 RepID=A0ABV2AP11_9EUKA
METLCQNRALKAFGLDSNEWGVNVQAFSGSIANLAVFSALLENGDHFLALDINCGGQFIFHMIKFLQFFRTFVLCSRIYYKI